MGNAKINLTVRYLFAAYLCIAMPMAQAVGLHMHVQHDAHSSVAPEHSHNVDIHTSSIAHDDMVSDDHHLVTIDISQESLVKKMSQLDSLALVVILFGFILFPPLLSRVTGQWRYRPPDIKTCHHLLCHHLRAPPVS